MRPAAIVIFAAIFAAFYFGRRETEQDAHGNPVVRPFGATIACLICAVFFVWETWNKIDDPFYRRNPENLYILGSFIAFSLGTSIGLHFTYVTLRSGKVVEHIPLLWHKEISVSEVRSIENEGQVTMLRFAGGQKIGLVHIFSGVPGFTRMLRRAAPHLRDEA